MCSKVCAIIQLVSLFIIWCNQIRSWKIFVSVCSKETEKNINHLKKKNWMCTQIYENGELSRKIYKFYATYRVYKNLFAIVSFVISNFLFFTWIFQTHPHNLRHKHIMKFEYTWEKRKKENAYNTFSLLRKKTTIYVCCKYLNRIYKLVSLFENTVFILNRFIHLCSVLDFLFCNWYAHSYNLSMSVTDIPCST